MIRLLRRLIVGVLALVGLMSLVMMAALGGGAWWLYKQMHAHTAPAVPSTALLRLSLGGTLSDGRESGVARLLDRGNPTLSGLVEVLDRAAADGRVGGILVDLGQVNPSFASAQEMRSAVERFRASGKRAVAFADTFGEGRSGNTAYYLATGFDEIWMQPSGELGIVGFAMERPFIADLLQTLEITPRFSQRHEFKGGIDTFTERNLSPALKQSLGGVLDSLHGQLVAGVARGRRLAEPAVRQMIEKAPLFADEAKAGGLVDGIGYADEAETALRRAAAPEARFIDFDDYADALPETPAQGPRIAVIRGAGPVVRGGSEDGPTFGAGETLSADDVAKAFRAASSEQGVRGILFRVDSPGGSYVASDTVWRAMREARDNGMPVVVSMGGVAASGGYFVAMGADRIVAQPATLTGSIGVYSGKFVLSGLWDKLGVTWDRLASAPNANADSMNQDFTPEQRARFEAALDRIYADFSGRVAADRKLSPDRLDAVARGRVWTGAQAVEMGLVDALGGMEQAKAELRTLLKLSADAPLALEPYPPPRSSIDRIWDLLGGLESMSLTATRAWTEIKATIGYNGPSLHSPVRVRW